MQPVGEASGEASGEAPEKEEPQNLGEKSDKYLYTTFPYSRDETFGMREEKEGLFYLGNKQATIFNNNILIGGEKFKGTPGLWELIMSRHPHNFTKEDEANYVRLMIKTNALHRYNDPNNPYPKSSGGTKWERLLCKIWKNREEYKGKGLVSICDKLKRQGVLDTRSYKKSNSIIKK